MRCQVCYPGDIRRCDLSTDEPHELHKSLVTEDTPSRDRGSVVTWTGGWVPPPPSREFEERQRRARESNVKLGLALARTGLTLNDLLDDLNPQHKGAKQ